MGTLKTELVKHALVGGIKVLINTENWEKVKHAVSSLMGNSELSGIEKKSLVISAIKETGWNFAGFILGLAIEIALFALQTELADLTDNA